MAKIELGIGLDTSSMQEGAKAASASLGQLYEEMAKMNSSADKKNAIFDYMAKADAETRNFFETLTKVRTEYEKGAVANPQGKPTEIPVEIKFDKTEVQKKLDEIFKQQNHIDIGDLQQGLKNGKSPTEILKQANIDRLKNQFTAVNKEADELLAKMEKFDAVANPQEYASMANTVLKLEEVKNGLSDEIDRLESDRKKQPHGTGNFFGSVQRNLQGAPTFINNMGAGNFAAGAIQAVNTVGNLAKAGGASAEGAEGLLGMLGTGGLIAGGVALVAGAALAGGNALANQWEKASGDAVDMQTLYGKDIESKSGRINSMELRTLYSKAAERNAAIGTGYKTSEFIQTANNASRYGIDNAQIGMGVAEGVLKWQRYSGANRERLLNLVGTMNRYGGENGDIAIQAAYAGLQQSGLGKGQFDEFLNSMQRVIEDGISEGFIKSSEEVSANLAMLSKLSGNNALWSGEQGAQRYMQMSGGVASSVALQSTADVINFQTAQDIYNDKGINLRQYLDPTGKGGSVLTGTYVDSMQILERGLSPELLNSGFDRVSQLTGLNYDKAKGTFGGDVAGAVEWFRQMYDLNYTGAAQLLGMYKKRSEGSLTDSDYTKTIESLRTNPEFKSNETKMLTVVEKIANDVAKIGQPAFDIKLNLTDDVNRIISAINKGKSFDLGKDFESAAKNRLYDIQGVGQKSLATADVNAYNAMMSKAKDISPEDYSDAFYSIEKMRNMRDEDISLLNLNYANSFVNMSWSEIREFLDNGDFGTDARQKSFMEIDMMPEEMPYKNTGKSNRNMLRRHFGGMLSALSAETGESEDRISTMLAQMPSTQEQFWAMTDRKSEGGSNITQEEMRQYIEVLIKAISDKYEVSSDKIVRAINDSSVMVNIDGGF